VPTTIKDLVLTKGWPTLRGSTTVDRAQNWTEDAPSTARLREHGAVFLGKTTTPEFGWKGVTDSALTGITRNPWDVDRTPGGSSGGAAVAAAAGMGALHIGTDGGGSIRIPASFTGIFGLKPSYGRVPAYPSSPFSAVAHIGPMTRSVTDAALMLTVIAEPDPRDANGLPHDGRDWTIGLDNGVRGLRVAYAPTLNRQPVEDGVASRVAEAAARFADSGAKVEQIELDMPEVDEVFAAHWFAPAATLLAGIPAAQRDKIDSGLRAVAAEGAKLSAAQYIARGRQRETFAIAINHLFETYDVLLMPTMPIVAFGAGRDAPEDGPYAGWTSWTPFTYPFNLTRHPAASMPCGLANGMPVGLQIIGPMYREDLVLRAARAFESTLPIRLPPME
jgi:aspartyl-tRNA(Asn)/glutamyl-tRNA(Gln) amidotransferase subunit A